MTNPNPTSKALQEITEWLRHEVARARGVAPDTLDLTEKFHRLGIDSAKAAALTIALGKWLGRPLSPMIFWKFPTLNALAKYLSGETVAEEETETKQLVSGPTKGGFDEPIAIIGIGCRFPGGAHSPEAFWQLLRNRENAICDIPSDRWDREEYFDEDYTVPGKMNVRRGGFLERVDTFDPLFFGITPREAAQMDPQQRLMLELAWEAVEDAGVLPETLRGSRTGVFCGMAFNDYSILKSRLGLEAITTHTTVGSIACIVANRISYAFGLEGPSLSLDTACSSSLVAVHLACQSLRLGECTLALAGGVSLMLAPDTAIALSQLGALSPDGQCHTFDAGANGFARAEGGGVVVLKRLSDAVRDGDPIYCVIRGSAVNNDGASNGLTAPNPKAQESVIRDACRNAGIEPASLHYVETHGTGTPIGDPIETASLGAVYGVDRSADRPLLIGSAKTNVGHLEAAAGMTGIVKVALALKHSLLPANLHFSKPSDQIDFEGLRLRVVTQLQAWPVADDERRRGAVSGFGIGGTNAHIILEDLPPQKTLLLIGGEDTAALEARVKQTQATLANNDVSLSELSNELLNKALHQKSEIPLDTVSTTCDSGWVRSCTATDLLNTGIKAAHPPAIAGGTDSTQQRLQTFEAKPLNNANQSHRVAVLAESVAELNKKLQAVLDNKPGKDVFRATAEVIAPQDPVWVFSGVGGQWLGMGCTLMTEQPVFRATLERFAKEIERHLGWSLFEELTAHRSASRLEQIDVLWPVLCAFQVALADQWRALGIKPAAVIGHSLGEVAAAYAAGVLSLEDSAAVACHWGSLVEQARGNGAMALVGVGWEEAKEVIAPFAERISRGVNSSPSTTILTGDVSALDQVVAQLTDRGVFARRIAVTIAAHSSKMETCVAELPSLLATVRPLKARVPFVSTNRGTFITGEELNGTYWQRQVCEPVKFAQGVACLIEQGHTLFLECNPHPVVQKAIEECLADSGKNGIVVGSLYRDEHEGNSLREALAKLYISGATVTRASDDEKRSFLLPISGRKEQAKKDYARSLAEHFERSEDVSLSDLCYTASVRRTHHSHRTAIVASTRADFVNALNAVAKGEKHPAVTSGRPRPSESTAVAFIYPGQGSQWHGMAKQLLKHEPVFRAVIEECDQAIRKYTDWSLLDELNADAASSQLARVDVVQPTLFSIAVALTELWRSWGIAPAAVVGHSMGEVAASYVAGALSLDDAARIICLRSKLLRRVSGQGIMAVTELPRAKAEEYVRGYEERVSIAVCNSPTSTVLSGEPAAIDEILSKLEAQDIFCRRVKVDVASHSPQMDPLREDLLAALAELKPRAGSVPIYSTVVGEVCDGSQFDASYWANNLRRPVQFVGAIESLLDAGVRTFLEISPHPLLSGNVREILKYRSIEGAAVSSLHRDEDERSTLHKGLAVLHCSGQPVDFASLYPQGGRVVSLPNYAWQRERYWLPVAAPSNGNSVPRQSQIEPANATSSNSSRLYFHNGWEPAPLQVATESSNTAGSILIFGANEEVLRHGRTALASAKSPIVLVQAASGYRELGGLRYEINPEQPGDYERLIEALAQSNLTPGRIIYCWSAAEIANEIKSQLDHSVYSILYLTQALLKAKPTHPVRLWYVFTTAPNQVQPAYAALSGSFKTVRQENPQFIFKTVEIRSTTPQIWKWMSSEINVEGNAEFEVRYENDLRFARRLSEVQIEDKTQSAKHVLPLKKDGVYLITGGAGGLGFLFAEHLARQERVKLVLTGRSSLSAGKAAQVERLKTLGAEVAYFQNDISQRDDAVALVKEVKSRFGSINGVLHVAGVLDRSFVGKKQANGVGSILGPKVYGTINLDDVLKNEPLDFFVFFSSISAVKGYEGLFDYAYGNSFMDHFAELRENLRAEERRFGRSISINWSLWQDGGMQLAQDEAALFLEQTGLEVLTLREGAKLHDVCATQTQVHQCLVGFGDREKFNEFLNPLPPTIALINQPAVATCGSSSPESQQVDTGVLREKVATYLTGKLAEVTGLPADEFDPQERFVTYGIDSVIVHRFNAKLSKDLGPVSKTLLFENKNIDELTNYFATNHAAVLTKLLGLAAAPKVETPIPQPPVTVAPIEVKVEPKIEATKVDEDDIAIIGVSGRYPHANNLEEFWQNLKAGRDCIDEIRGDRWDYRKYFDPDPNKSSEGKTYSKWAGMIDDVEKFDPLFFNLSVKEAESMDPQERVFLETAWTAFEDAGYSRKRLRSYVDQSNGTDVGVFVGCTSNTHMMLGPAEWDAGNYALPLSMPWSLANRVSHVLDLHGPSLPVDTGCASSLTAIHLACESLKTGECSMALAGGVNLVVHPSKFNYPTKYRMLSPTGRCRAFGSEADGIVIGEGVGAVVLKRLRDAVRDGDHIYAVIKGTASNHGGQVNGYTVPSPQAQASLIQQALKRANVNARTVTCIEAHGTGTALGDPIEVAGLMKAFGEQTADKQFCSLGSVKSNIGHLEGAAGLAGLTKVLLQMKHRQFVPSLHAAATNADINFEESPFVVRTELSEWEQPVVDSKTFPRRAGISSFGAGGSNAHVLIEEYVEQITNRSATADSCLFLLSARSDERLRVYARNLADFVDRTFTQTEDDANRPALADIAYTLQVGREPLEERLAIVAQSHGELSGALRALAENRVANTEVMRSTTGKSTISSSARKELAENISDWLKRGQLTLLSEAWLKGIDVDWKQLPQNSQRRAVSLPTYPFLKERVWIHDRTVLCDPPQRVSTNSHQAALHPLVDTNESTLSEERFRKLLTGDEFFLRDHRVGDHLVLPGVAIVEMARAAGEIAAERRVSKVRNIIFSSPVSIASEPKAFFIGLQPDGESVDFQVYSLNQEGQRETHTQGKLVYESVEPADSEWIDLESIRQRCHSTVQSSDGYQVLHDLGLQLGPSFQPVGEIHYNDIEAFSRLELPIHLQDGFDQFVLHPSLMDGAQQVTGLTRLLGKEDRVRVPFAVGEIEISGRLTPVCYAHVKLVGGNDGLNSANRKFDISIADETGRVVVAIKRFQTRDFVNRSSDVKAIDRSADSVSEPFYFQERWEPSNAPLQASGDQRVGTVLLFDTGDQLRDALRSRLQEKSGARVNVILVKPGKTFRSFGEQGYTIDPRNSTDYERLFEGLKGRDRMPDAIVHLWSQESFSTDSEQLHQQLTNSVYSVFSTVQSLLDHNPVKQTQLLYGFSSSHSDSQPQYAALRGFGATLQKESPKLNCKSLEFVSFHEETNELAGILATELLCGDTSELEIRYENGTRYTHRFQEVRNSSLTNSETKLKNNGVYLLTGGTGGLGLLFAEYLAHNYKAKLVLTGRSEINSDQQARLDSLRRAGAEVLYVRADVSQRSDVIALVNEAKARFGQINGVLHCAGITHDALTKNKTRDDVERVLAPKVFGTIHLDEALADESLDFLVTFSSTTALLGHVGLSDYGYANRFMDHFTSWREQQRGADKRSGKSLSINWPLWRDGGMGLSTQGEELLYTSTGMRAMSAQDGLEAFERALASEHNRLFVIAGDRNRIQKTLNLNSEPAVEVAPVTHVEPKATNVAHSASALQSLQRDLVKTVSAVLKIAEERITLDKNVSDFGFDSVSLVEFSNQLNRKYRLEITPTIFFEYPSLKTFSKYLVDEHSDAIASHYAVVEAPKVAAKPIAPVVDTSSMLPVSRLRPAAPQVEAAPLQDQNVTHEANAKEPIAIIGMSGVMPQSDDLDAFWKHLEAGHDLITEIPPDRWDWKAYFGNPTEEANKTNIKWGGFINDVDKFDARFFGISRREAEFMDPQQRIFLETVWKAIEDAGYKASELAGQKVGVFAGVAGLDYGELMRDNGVEIEAYSTTGVFHCIVANRVSYLLNLTGPSVPVDTGCSSALVAIRQAIEAIWTGSCDMAIAGGVNALLSPSVFIAFSKAGMLSVDGRCKTFDQKANGYVRAEGAGVLLLKPLSKAIADRDNIHAIIRGSAVNHGGRVNTLTAPNPNAQAELIAKAFAEGDIDPTTVSYVEAHGTGTALGDPIEINGLKKAFREMFDKRGVAAPEKPFCGVGSVKTNTGHLETAAAMAGIFKVILGMKNNKIPGSIHLNEVNPYIQLENTPLYLVNRTQPWERQLDLNKRELPRRAGVSSFGFGGVSGHVVLEEFVSRRNEQVDNDEPQVIVLSARNEERLEVYASQVASYLESHLDGSDTQRRELPTDGNFLPLLQQELVHIAASVLDVNDTNIYPDEPLSDYGFDGVHLTQLTERLNDEYGLGPVSLSLLEHQSLNALATTLWEERADQLITRFKAQQERQRQQPSLADVAYTLQVGREAMAERVAFVATSLTEVIAKLKSFSQDSDSSERVYRGNIEKTGSALELVLNGTEGAEFVQMLVQGRKFEKLAQLWTSGINVDWKALQTHSGARRITLPTYPFARDRYWFSETTRKSERKNTTAVHPLIDHPELSLSLNGALVFNKSLKSSEPIVSQHNVAGKLVLPGVGHVAMAVAALAQVKETESVELKRVLWLRPVVVDGESKEVHVHLREDNGTLQYEVRSGSDGVKHSSGTLRSIPAPTVREQVPVNKIKARCTAGPDKTSLYKKFSERGVTLGSYFQTLEQTWINHEEFLAELSLSTEFQEEVNDYFVHPGMMDAALQSIAPLWWARNGENKSPLLPFAIERVELLRPLRVKGYVYVKAAGDQSFNAALLDESGLVCAKLHEVTLREAAGPDSGPGGQFYFRPVWKEATELLGHRNSRQPATKRESVLIIRRFDESKLASALRTALADSEIFEVCLGDNPGALANDIRQIPSIDHVYFLGGIQSQTSETIDINRLEESQDRGVISLFRLVKVLDERGLAQSGLRLTVVTNDVHQVNAGQVTIPYAASLFGLVKSIAKEYPSWAVNCIDISQADAAKPEVIQAIVSEPKSENGNEIVLRNGRRYARVLEPIELPPSKDPVFRQNGVYLILGGAGGLGLELGKHLAQTVQARLVLVGRNPLNEQQRQQVDHITSLGAQVLYIQADASNLDSMQSAVKQARAAFGPIHGVIHSALVLSDKTIANMTEEELRLALRPKVQGSINLHLATADEPLDFMLFFSSAQSFSGNAGQSNYAAGCTFKDAFAEYLRQSVSYDVKTINWGYWGDVGVVASAEYKRRLAAQGVGSISIAEGMQAVQTVLENRVGQVVAAHGDERLLARLGVELHERVEVYPATGASVMESALGTITVAVESQEVVEWRQAFEAVEIFGQHLLLNMFRKMGVFHRGTESYEREDLKRQLGIVPAHSQLFEALLGMMARAGLVRVDGSRLDGTSTLDHIDPDLNLPRQFDQLVAAYPQKEAHLKLLSHCMENAPRILRGEVPATEVIFPQSSLDLVSGIYKNNPTADYFNQLVVADVRSHIEARLSSLPETEKITILEVGAGTGGTSAALFEDLKKYADRLRYLYTDISGSFTKYGKTNYGPANPYVEFRTLDVEQDVEPQGYQPASCDVVIGTNVLHATSEIAATLRRVKSLLKTHGWLVINEGTSFQNFATLTFGFLEGWWRFKDAGNRLAGSPLLDCDSWKHVLNLEGFDRVVVQGAPHGKDLGQNVIVAESNGLVRNENKAAVATSVVRPEIPLDTVSTTCDSGWVRSCTATDLLNTGIKAAHPPAIAGGTDSAHQRLQTFEAKPVANRTIDVRQHVEKAIIETLADILQLENDELGLNSSYTNLGVDSILSVEIVNSLNKQLGIDLRSTDLFNYPTIRALTAHVVERFGTQIKTTLETVSDQNSIVESLAPEELTECDSLFESPAVANDPIEISATVALQPAARVSQSNAVAIIGMSGKFPEANNVNEFWSNLAGGKNSIHEASRWDLNSLYDPDQRNAKKSYAKWAGLLSDIELFDPLFFNLSPKEAEMMDPRQRLFLEEAWKALEDAGYSDKQIEGKNCSVFVGCGPGDYKRKISEANVTPNPYIFTGNQNSILAARLSYLLNLKGPTVPIDTACSSSLVAIHLACESIRNGVSEMAIAGGSEVICTPEFLVLGSRANMLSPVGQCKTFADDADGFVPGEAVGALVLKNLDAARRDGDHIYAVITGSGINQDGKTNGITAPSAPAQTALECEVYDRFGINPAEISYVEAHGTGTRLGDPIEVQALTDAFRRYTSATQFCALGSVKTNIGHTLTAAGVSSVIKVLLSLQHRQLPPSINFTQPNRHIDFANSPFYVNTKLQSWTPGNGRKRQAAVSSFGFSGTNAHLVLSEADEAPSRPADRLQSYLFVLSAQTSTALDQKISDLSAWLAQTQSPALLRDVAYTLHLGRSHFSERVAVVADSQAELAEKLQALSCGETVTNVYRTATQKRNKADDERGAELLRAAVAQPSRAERRALLGELGQLFVQSCELDWAQLYKAEDHQRLSLPTYPFAREYFWVPQAPKAELRQAEATFQLRPVDPRTSQEQQFTTRLNGEEFFIRDHQIENKRVLPGVAYLELGRSAAELAGQQKVATLRNIVWMKPLTIEAEPCEISISLRQRNDAVIYDVSTKTNKQQSVSFAQGEVLYQQSTADHAEPKVDLTAIRARCVKYVSGDSCYEEFRAIGFDYGPSFRVIQELSYNENEVLACMALPATRISELKDFVLHPSLLDGALQSGLWLMDSETLAETRYLPFAIGELRIREALRPICYVHVTKSKHQAHLRKFNVRILDESGNVLVQIIDYAAKAQRQPARREVTLAQTFHPFEGRTRIPAAMISDDVIGDVFRNVEAGELDVTRAQLLIQQLALPQEPVAALEHGQYPLR